MSDGTHHHRYFRIRNYPSIIILAKDVIREDCSFVPGYYNDILVRILTESSNDTQEPASLKKRYHTRIRDAANPAARSAPKTLSGARVGAGSTPPGVPATGIPPRVRVPEREPPILHSVSTRISPLLPFSWGRL
jgi:hypothetical protein